MNRGATFLAFTVGVGAGFLAARRYFSEKFRRIADDEIESVKSAMNRRNVNMTVETDTTPETIKPLAKIPTADGSSRINYARILGYDTVTKGREGAEKPVITAKEPYVIPPEEFGDADGYEQINLTYYGDGTLADDDDVAMSEAEIERSIGADALHHFGEYEDDSVFVRNDDLKCEYEILLDQRAYSEVVAEKPHIRRG